MKIGRGRIVLSLSEPSIRSQGLLQLGFLGLNFSFAAY